MKHPFIIGGVAFGIVAIGAIVWVYLFMFYSPAPEETVAGDDNPFVEVEGEAFGTRVEDEGEEVDGVSEATPGAFRVVTPRAVVGAVELADGTYRFVEAGTGHVYQVDGSGNESRLTNTTFPRTIDAVWAPTGERVALVQEENGQTTVFVGTVTAGERSATLEGETFEQEISNIAWDDTGATLLYTVPTRTGIAGIARNLDTDTEKTLFEVPLGDIRVSWDDMVPLIVTPATHNRPGYAYDASLTRVAESLPALTGIQHGGRMLFSGLRGSSLISWTQENNEIVSLQQTGVITEKCALSDTYALCAVPKELNLSRYPDSWYRGEERYDDEVVIVSTETGESRSLGMVSSATREEFDVLSIVSTSRGALMLSRDGVLVSVLVESVEETP